MLAIVRGLLNEEVPICQPYVQQTKQGFKSLWPSDIIWRHWSGWTLAEIITCCLTAPNHYLNQCWHVISKELIWDHYHSKIWRYLSVKKTGNCLLKIEFKSGRKSSLHFSNNAAPILYDCRSGAQRMVCDTSIELKQIQPQKYQLDNSFQRNVIPHNSPTVTHNEFIRILLFTAYM